MSHNLMKIASQEQSSSSEVSISLNNLSDVSSSSPSNNSVLTFNGSEYVTQVKDESDIVTGYLFANTNYTVTNVTSTYDLVSINSKFIDTQFSAGYGRQETLGGLVSVTTWPSGVSAIAHIYCQFQLASGQFLLISSTRGHFSSSSSSSVMCWMDGAYNKLGPEVILEPPAGGMRGSKKILGYINTNTTTKVHVGFVSTSGHLRRRNNRGFTVQIIRIGDYLS